MVKIPLTQGKFAIVDDADAERVAQYRWHLVICKSAAGGKTLFYAIREMTNENGKRAMVYMHRFILGLKPGDPNVDHWNGDGLDNQRLNLRPSTQSNNSGNRRTIRSKSGYKGVYFSRGSWCSRICCQHRLFDLGRFNTPEEAAAAYDLKAKELFGEFAATNAALRSGVLVDERQAAITLPKSRIETNTSGFTGVSLHGSSWLVQICIIGPDQKKHKIHVGCYKTPEEASVAYQRAMIAKEIFGEYAGPYIQLIARGETPLYDRHRQQRGLKSNTVGRQWQWC